MLWGIGFGGLRFRILGFRDLRFRVKARTRWVVHSLPIKFHSIICPPNPRPYSYRGLGFRGTNMML